MKKEDDPKDPYCPVRGAWHVQRGAVPLPTIRQALQNGQADKGKTHGETLILETVCGTVKHLSQKQVEETAQKLIAVFGPKRSLVEPNREHESLPDLLFRTNDRVQDWLR